ncbi:DUF7344 domain-containing protein [Halorubellus salinus]|uniref:DUF7344 domain-containing protein n=1 Tax=Halorubellus salinus TaxID=755309 RepID=UPI001D0872BD|nr:hypothetical protein [Halorubellus salinus]
MDEDDSDTPQTGGSGGCSPSGGLDAETHRALGSTVRRRVLDLVLDDPREWSRGELATELVEWDRTATGASAQPPSRDHLLLVLHHDHLPRLDDAGLLSYDPEDGIVSPEPVDDAVVRAVRQATDHEDDD